MASGTVRLSGSERKGSKRVSLLFARRVFTPTRLKLLRWIKRFKPVSIYALARDVHRRKEAVLEDLRWLRKAGLVELIPATSNGRKRLAPRVKITKIAITVEI